MSLILIEQIKSYSLMDKSNTTIESRFLEPLNQESPLQIVGVINAYNALLAEKAGFSALYLSGAGVANAGFGLPDLGLTSLNDVTEEVRRITDVSQLPLLVDADTGWGDVFNVARTVKQLSKAGAAAIHIEDQIQYKRCGHQPNKVLVSCEKMVDRIKSAVDARTDSQFSIMARTDAFASEGINAAIDRAKCYVEAGADMVFAEALITLDDYAHFTQVISVPVLANMTEFGQTPLYTVDELKQVGVSLILYPLSAFRAMSQAALEVYQTIREQGTQQSVVKKMQSRAELYEILDYHSYEIKLDQLFKRNEE